MIYLVNKTLPKETKLRLAAGDPTEAATIKRDEVLRIGSELLWIEAVFPTGKAEVVYLNDDPAKPFVAHYVDIYVQRGIGMSRTYPHWGWLPVDLVGVAMSSDDVAATVPITEGAYRIVTP